jgi:hypothetical protein
LVDDTFEELVTLGIGPVEFTDPPGAQVAPFVDEVDGGPDGVAPGVPIPEVLVKEDREFESGFACCGPGLGRVPLGLGLWGLNPDDLDAPASQAFVPASVDGEVRLTIVALEGVEVDDDHLPTEVGEANGFAGEPGGRRDPFRNHRVRAAVGGGVAGIAENGSPALPLSGSQEFLGGGAFRLPQLVESGDIGRDGPTLVGLHDGFRLVGDEEKGSEGVGLRRAQLEVRGEIPAEECACPLRLQFELAESWEGVAAVDGIEVRSKSCLTGVEHRIESGPWRIAEGHPEGIGLPEESFELIQCRAGNIEFALDLGGVDECQGRPGHQGIVGAERSVLEWRRGMDRGEAKESQQDPDESQAAHAGSVAEAWGNG